MMYYTCTKGGSECGRTMDYIIRNSNMERVHFFFFKAYVSHTIASGLCTSVCMYMYTLVWVMCTSVYMHVHVGGCFQTGKSFYGNYM